MAYPKSYWRPHLIVEKVYYDSLGETLYNTGLHEVYYEHGEPVSWTKNSCSITSSGENINESISEATGLIDIYKTAKENIVYFINIDDYGNEYLKSAHPNNAIQYDPVSEEWLFNYTEEGSDDFDDVQIDLDDNIMTYLDNLGIDPKKPQGSEDLYNMIHGALYSVIDESLDNNDDVDEYEKQRLKDRLVNRVSVENNNSSE